MKEMLLTEKEMVLLVLLYFHAFLNQNVNIGPSLWNRGNSFLLIVRFLSFFLFLKKNPAISKHRSPLMLGYYRPERLNLKEYSTLTILTGKSFINNMFLKTCKNRILAPSGWSFCYVYSSNYKFYKFYCLILQMFKKANSPNNQKWNALYFATFSLVKCELVFGLTLKDASSHIILMMVNGKNAISSITLS